MILKKLKFRHVKKTLFLCMSVSINVNWRESQSSFFLIHKIKNDELVELRLKLNYIGRNGR